MRRTVSETSCLGECELTILLGQAGGNDIPVRQVMGELTPILGEIYNCINGLTVSATTYQRLFSVYTDLERSSGRS